MVIKKKLTADLREERPYETSDMKVTIAASVLGLL